MFVYLSVNLLQNPKIVNYYNIIRTTTDTTILIFRLLSFQLFRSLYHSETNLDKLLALDKFILINMLQIDSTCVLVNMISIVSQLNFLVTLPK